MRTKVYPKADGKGRMTWWWRQVSKETVGIEHGPFVDRAEAVDAAGAAKVTHRAAKDAGRRDLRTALFGK